MKPNLVVLISGQGRNLQAMIDGIAAGRIPARLAAVISNNPAAPGLGRAARAGIHAGVVPHTAFPDRPSFEAALQREIDAHEPALIALAGFMRMLTPQFVQRYAGRLLNIHPSLLPRYPGLHTHRRVLAAGDRVHGASVHFVTEELDGGPVVVQGEVPVLERDDEHVLGERVMQEVERRIYPQAIAWLARGDLALVQNRVWFRGRPLPAPLGLADLEEAFR